MVSVELQHCRCHRHRHSHVLPRTIRTIATQGLHWGSNDELALSEACSAQLCITFRVILSNYN